MNTTSARANSPSSLENDETICPLCGKFPECGGLGLIRYEVPVDHPNFGKMFRCPNNPQEEDVNWQQRLRGLSNLRSFANKTLDNFTIREHIYTVSEEKSLTFALNRAIDFAENLNGWLLLEGKYGTGKTHLAAAIGNARLDRGDAVLFITTPDLLDHLRASYGPSSEVRYDDLFERVRNAPILILDDLGVENPSPWAQEKLFQLINHRYVNRLPTVITTNADIEKMDQRVSSRLLDVGLVSRVNISAPDYRSHSQEEQRKLRTNLNLHQHMTFDTFDINAFTTNDERQNLRKVAMAAEAYARQPNGWFFLYGKFGSGKTHLAASIAHEVQSTERKVMFLTAPDLLDYLRVTFSPNSPATFDQRLNELRDAYLLVIDDLGAESSTPWAQEKLFQLLDYRYLTNAPTVITTPKTPNALSERLRTRILDERICVMYALDVRGYALRKRGVFPKQESNE